VTNVVARAHRTLYLTGTPMENRVEEFRTLVGQLQPRLAASIRPVELIADPAAFRRRVAPAYLRRNQADVLDELPPRIETEEWVELNAHDLRCYREAVVSRNFMAMRRAAYAAGDRSAKLLRLLEIVAEAQANGRKVVIFSFFRDVLAAVATTLGDAVIGVITGNVPPAQRQELLDRFSAAGEPCVLVSQIEAGGVGLNMQAASVVILTEPQWKPTVEDQAIARLHRMGQAESVDVHRILAEDSVDQRMLEVLGAKAALFDEYVRRSSAKEVSPDAVDVSDLETTREVATQAQHEHHIIELERRRLGVTQTAGAS
jgi:SNF2 family DNA or RNA helicase